MARQRLTATEARQRILDAALRRVREEGPDALTLKALARDIGVSHPAILHHFGSREALMAAVVREAIDRVRREIIGAYGGLRERMRAVKDAGEAWKGPPPAAIETFLALAERDLVAGQRGRLFGWLALAGRVGSSDLDEIGLPVLDLAERAIEADDEEGFLRSLEEDEVLFSFLTGAFVILGMSVFGSFLFPSAGLDPDKDRARYRRWLARKLVRYRDPT